MEDSLEAYLRISKNKIDEPTVEKKEAAQITTALKKKECDMRALKIVEFSIEGKLRPEVFTKCLPYINRSYYQDIVEERAVTKLCGYSLCGKRIPDMPKKQYFISAKRNKVYDITDRKNYCSNFCYKASLHLKNQIDDSPLWLRKSDDIPEYQLLDPADGGLPGELIDQGVAKPVKDTNMFIPVNSFAEVSLQDMVDKEKGKDTKKKAKKMKSHKTPMQTINENSEQFQENEVEVESSPVKINKKEKVCQAASSSNKFLPVIEESEEKMDTTKETVESKMDATNEIEKMDTTKETVGEKVAIVRETVEEKMDETKEFSGEKMYTTKEVSGEKIETTKKAPVKKLKKKSSKLDITEIESLLRRLLKEWLTLESYLFLFGEKKIKEILDEKKLSEYFDELKIAELQTNQQVKYMEICKRLHLQEMADEKFDNALLENKHLKPLPDYRQLKQENKELDLKVKTFFKGQFYEQENTNFPTKINNSNKISNKEEESPQQILPLVDTNSQTNFRRKIFLTSLTKSLQLLLQVLQLGPYATILSDVQSLVKTLNLKANNITFKPFFWNYVSLILLHILSIKNRNIKDVLTEESSKEKWELFLSTPFQNDFIDSVMSRICDIDSFVEDYICTS